MGDNHSESVTERGPQNGFAVEYSRYEDLTVEDRAAILDLVQYEYQTDADVLAEMVEDPNVLGLDCYYVRESGTGRIQTFAAAALYDNVPANGRYSNSTIEIRYPSSLNRFAVRDPELEEVFTHAITRSQVRAISRLMPTNKTDERRIVALRENPLLSLLVDNIEDGRGEFLERIFFEAFFKQEEWQLMLDLTEVMGSVDKVGVSVEHEKKRGRGNDQLRITQHMSQPAERRYRDVVYPVLATVFTHREFVGIRRNIRCFFDQIRDIRARGLKVIQNTADRYHFGIPVARAQGHYDKWQQTPDDLQLADDFTETTFTINLVRC